MSLVVNTNVSSINSQRQLGKVQLAMTKSLERLSSGLRINHSSDDAAGLAISTGMNAQTSGMEQAARNANDGLSVIQTADGAISEQVEILQRIRVLAVQASSDLNSSDNLKSIQEEINQQVKELTRIGDTTNFNGMSLINGTFSSKSIQVGANAGETIDLSIGDYRAAYMGGYAELKGSAVGAAPAGQIMNAIAGGGDVTLGPLGGTAVSIAQSKTDGVSAYFSDRSAIAKATAINASTSQHGVTATVGATTLTGASAVAASAFSGTATSALTINGVAIIKVGDTMSISAGDSTGALRALINAKTTQTGVVASLDSSSKLVLTASDGRNILVDVGAGTAAASAAGMSGFGANVTGSTTAAATHAATGIITLRSNTDFVVGGTADYLIGNGIARNTYNVSGKTIATIDVTDKVNDGAGSAIRSVDSALAKITNEQAKLGAMSNRFSHTISNLQISIENLTAARSRITDTDFAVETASLTRAQIIQQAGTAMLSQANTLPQAALNLLQ